jgi:hypothetical protein
MIAAILAQLIPPGAALAEPVINRMPRDRSLSLRIGDVRTTHRCRDPLMAENALAHRQRLLTEPSAAWRFIVRSNGRSSGAFSAT